MAKQYAKNACLNRCARTRLSNTDHFMMILSNQIVIQKGLSVPMVMRLKSLSLCGFDLDSILTKSSYFGINFNSLRSLTLESCAGVELALPKLMGPGVVCRDTLGALQLEAFVLRHESPAENFPQVLETFLLSLRPLKTLHILLEDLCQAYFPYKALNHHGKALQSLIWNNRITRDAILNDTLPNKFSHLKYIARHCTRLKALGITLDWEALASPDKKQQVGLLHRLGIQR